MPWKTMSNTSLDNLTYILQCFPHTPFITIMHVTFVLSVSLCNIDHTPTFNQLFQTNTLCKFSFQWPHITPQSNATTACNSFHLDESNQLERDCKMLGVLTSWQSGSDLWLVHRTNDTFY